MLEGAANFTEVKGSEVAVAFVVPFWSASSVIKIKHNSIKDYVLKSYMNIKIVKRLM